MKSDHQHLCCCCGHVWDCFEYTLKQCEAKGVARAVKVNKDGPYCHVCRHLWMACAHSHLERRPVRYLLGLVSDKFLETLWDKAPTLADPSEASETAAGRPAKARSSKAKRPPRPKA